jgi:lantibiotic modifying enzyme
LDRAVQLSKQALALTEAGNNLDLISGIGGVLLVLLAVDAVAPGTVLKDARRAAQLLGLGLSKPNPPLPYRRGASHGFSGALWALSAAAAYLNDAHPMLPALISRELQLSTAGDWTDVGDDLHVNQIAWCHGPLGIALCRAAAALALGSEDLRRGALEALRDAQNAPLPEAMGLCHGLAGALDVDVLSCDLLLLDAHRRIAPGTRRLSALTAAKLSVKSGLPDIGLMTGLTGVGLALLRAADSYIPGALLLQAPLVLHLKD